MFLTPASLYDTLVNVVLLLRNGVLDSTGPQLAHLPVLHEGVQASPVPTMFTPTIAFEPNKGIREVVDCAL